MDGSYSQADLTTMSMDEASSFFTKVIDFTKENDDPTFKQVALAILEPRDDITLHESFFLKLASFPYPEMVLNYRERVIDFLNILSLFSIEATIFFAKNIVNAFSHSFTGLKTLEFYCPKLLTVLESTKEEINCHEIWDEEWDMTKEMIGVLHIFPMWKTDISTSNVFRGAYLGEIDKLIDRTIFLYNYFLVGDYVQKAPETTIDDLFNDGIHQPIREKKTITKKSSFVPRQTPKKRIDLKPKKEIFQVSVINSAFKKYVKKTDVVKEI